jgi:hypothetical protein
MPRPIKRWPNYALESLEGTLFELKSIAEISRQVQVAAKNGDAMEVAMLAGDIRERTQSAVHLLVQARTGEYESAAP